MLSTFVLPGFLLSLALVSAHFNLRDPMPYNRMQCSPHSPPNCLPPCPRTDLQGFSRAQNSPDTPSRIWRRGQHVSVQWHRNNHDGGFYRRSLVPLAHMNNATWHLRTAFEWGCWSQGFFQCGRTPDCGTDKLGLAYQNYMVVPKVLPDGDYVFAMVWYGGIHFKRKRAMFPDYYTCAYVRIQGGPLEETYTPTFVPGYNQFRDIPPGMCASTSSFIDECGGRPCYQNPVRHIVAGAFQSGKAPRKIYLRDFVEAIEAYNASRRYNETWQKRYKNSAHHIYCRMFPVKC